MGVKVEDITSGKHYILNEAGAAVEFSTDMLIGDTKEFSLPSPRVILSDPADD